LAVCIFGSSLLSTSGDLEAAAPRLLDTIVLAEATAPFTPGNEFVKKKKKLGYKKGYRNLWQS
jgi:hypothetical protein